MESLDTQRELIELYTEYIECQKKVKLAKINQNIEHDEDLQNVYGCCTDL